MFIFEWVASVLSGSPSSLLDLLFGSLYGGLLFALGALAAIPYGIWQGLKWLGHHFQGGRHGDPRTGG